MAERLYVSPGTVVRLEKGDATVRLGISLTAVWVLGFDRKLADVFDAFKDQLGLRLEHGQAVCRLSCHRRKLMVTYTCVWCIRTRFDAQVFASKCSMKVFMERSG